MLMYIKKQSKFDNMVRFPLNEHDWKRACDVEGIEGGGGQSDSCSENK